MPTIAVVHGAAIGSGSEIAAACDFIVATPEATFATPEALWGTVGATQRLPRVLGKRLAKDLMFTGRKLDRRGGEDRRAGDAHRRARPARRGARRDRRRPSARHRRRACARPSAASTRAASSIRAAPSRSSCWRSRRTWRRTPGAPAWQASRARRDKTRHELDAADALRVRRRARRHARRRRGAGDDDRAPHLSRAAPTPCAAPPRRCTRSASDAATSSASSWATTRPG